MCMYSLYIPICIHMFYIQIIYTYIHVMDILIHIPDAHLTHRGAKVCSIANLPMAVPRHTKPMEVL